MAHQFLFLCPVCQKEDTVLDSRCQHCGSEIVFRQGKFVSAGRKWNPSELGRWMRETISVRQAEAVLARRRNGLPAELATKAFRISQEAILRQGREIVPFTGYRGLFRRLIEKPVVLARGRLLFVADSVVFVGERETHRFPLTDFTCVTTNSHYFEFKVKGQPFFQIDFLHESPYKYEVLFRKLLENFYARQGKRVLEYQPHLRFDPPTLNIAAEPVAPPGRPMRRRFLEKLAIVSIQWLLRVFFRLRIRVRIQGGEFLPRDGFFVALANHQSIFDPFIIGTYLDSRIGFFTKSTSFLKGIERFFLHLTRGIPTTRYQTDPLVYRHARLFLEKGIPVGIFPEGERCWDGALQPFKFSVFRLLAWLKVPVLPIVVNGAYNYWPRWAKKPCRNTVTLTVLPPFCLLTDLYPAEQLKRFVEEMFRSRL